MLRCCYVAMLLCRTPLSIPDGQVLGGGRAAGGGANPISTCILYALWAMGYGPMAYDLWAMGLWAYGLGDLVVFFSCSRP